MKTPEPRAESRMWDWVLAGATGLVFVAAGAAVGVWLVAPPGSSRNVSADTPASGRDVSFERNTVKAEPAAGCDLGRAPCAADVPGGGRIELSVEPRPIPVLKPLSLTVRVEGLQASAAEVDLTGVDMPMPAFSPARLTEDGPQRFSGTAILPACTQTRMTWQASVLVRADSGEILAPFRFEAARH